MTEYLYKEIESRYLNISFNVYARNIIDVISNYTDLERVYFDIDRILSYSNSLELLRDYKLEIASIRDLLFTFNKFTRYKEFITEDFIYLLEKNLIYKVINLKVSTKAKNCITYNFYPDKALKYLKRDPEIINKNRTLEYAGAFYYSILLMVIFAIINNKVSTSEYEDLSSLSYEKLSSGILTGFSAYTEFYSNESSGVMEELLCLVSSDNKRLVVTKNPDKEAIEFKIKRNIIFQERYEAEGYSNLIYNENIEKDRNLNSIFRITKGKHPNSVRFTFKRASGYRTLGRILEYSEERKTHINKLYDSGIFGIRNMLIFCFFSILDNCSGRDFRLSKYSAFNKFIKHYKPEGKRYVAERIAVISLIAIHPELQDKIIEKYFKHRGQREDILKEIKVLRRLINVKSDSALIDFIKEIRRHYVW